MYIKPGDFCKYAENGSGVPEAWLTNAQRSNPTNKAPPAVPLQPDSKGLGTVMPSSSIPPPRKAEPPPIASKVEPAPLEIDKTKPLLDMKKMRAERGAVAQADLDRIYASPIDPGVMDPAPKSAPTKAKIDAPQPETPKKHPRKINKVDRDAGFTGEHTKRAPKPAPTQGPSYVPAKAGRTGLQQTARDFQAAATRGMRATPKFLHPLAKAMQRAPLPIAAGALALGGLGGYLMGDRGTTVKHEHNY